MFARLKRLRAGHPSERENTSAETKSTATGPLIAFYDTGRSSAARDFRSFAARGYAGNAVAYRCVRLIAEAVASVPLQLFEGRREVSAHPLLDLLARPNPRDTGAALSEALVTHLLVAGNAYVEAVSIDGISRELHALRPDRMRMLPGTNGWPSAYEYAIGSRSVRFAQEAPDAMRGFVPPILHLRLFNPLDDHDGLSPMEAASSALDIHNAASAWNRNLLENAARPSGALVYAGGDGRQLTPIQFERLKDELEANFQGATNAGRPLLLEGGLDWKPLSLSPKDMDFIEAKAAAAREIALAFGVPPMLLGIPGDATYANYQEANRTLWRQTVLPLAQRNARALLHWLSPAFEPRGTLDIALDLDRVDALSGEREALWRRVGAADFLDEDEKREAVGYGARSREGGP